MLADPQARATRSAAFPSPAFRPPPDSRTVFAVQNETVKVRSPSHRNIFHTPDLFFGGNLHESVPETLPAKQPALGPCLQVQIEQVPGICAASSNIAFAAFPGIEQRERDRRPEIAPARRQVPLHPRQTRPRNTGKNDRRPFRNVGVAARASQSFPATLRIMSSSSSRRKVCFDERTHGHVSGFLLRVANGNCFGQWHAGRIRGEGRECRYERVDTRRTALLSPSWRGDLLPSPTASSHPPSCPQASPWQP